MVLAQIMSLRIALAAALMILDLSKRSEIIQNIYFLIWHLMPVALGLHFELHGSDRLLKKYDRSQVSKPKSLPETAVPPKRALLHPQVHKWKDLCVCICLFVWLL